MSPPTPVTLDELEAARSQVVADEDQVEGTAPDIAEPLKQLGQQPSDFR